MSELNRKIEFRADDFELVNMNRRVTDEKIVTKRTTFAKDALKRFVKNKSSVVAAVLLGILLLLTIFVPILSPYNVTDVKTTEAFLAPKLFEAGTGFWDGTRKKTRVVYDAEYGIPAVSDKYSKEAVKASLVSITVDEEPTKLDSAISYGKGGVLVVATDAMIKDKDIYMVSKAFDITAKGDYRLSINFDDENGVSASECGEFAVYLVSKDEATEYCLRDFSKDYSALNVNLSDVLKENGLNSMSGKIKIKVKSAESAFQYVLVKNITLSANDSVMNAEDLAAISFDDATAFVLINDKDSVSYWACTGRKGIHDSLVYYCDYVIDTYYLVYGDADIITYSATDVKNWIEAGWCEYDYKVGPESFVKLSDECPIDTVVSQQIMGITKKLSSIQGRGFNYKRYGYTEMPKFIMGTDASGFDLFKRAFVGLRTSFLLGISVASFTFIVGLLWGSISGYFGGGVDMAMERFCEILGSVPMLVVLPLAILHWGNNFFTFMLALCFNGWLGTAGTTRMQFYRFKGREFVLASRTLGASDGRLIFTHILPNSMGTIITRSVFMITSVIYSESSFAYLKLGLQGQIAFGVDIAANQQYLSVYPNLVIFRAVIMTIMMISFNLFGNGLRDAFNPALKGSN